MMITKAYKNSSIVVTGNELVRFSFTTYGAAVSIGAGFETFEDALDAAKKELDGPAFGCPQRKNAIAGLINALSRIKLAKAN